MTIMPVPETAVRNLYQAINNRDFGVFNMLLADDWVDHLEIGLGDKAGFISAIKRVIEAMSDFAIIVEEILLSPHHVTARLSLTGTHSGEFLGVVPTGFLHCADGGR